ncbi:MAG: hypothetical protein DMF99_27440 [Acidobacteria bacterium]|nr:MAG: hypothetical protein DMF99_27440 [Acidobacteriota bacterium]
MMSAIGATPSGRWQFWQLRCRIGAISFVNVTSDGAAACCALSPNGIARPAAIAARANLRTNITLSFDITLGAGLQTGTAIMP